MIRSAERMAAFEATAREARDAFQARENDRCFELLKRAHILGQPWAGPHSWSHWMMLRVGVRRRDIREIGGQLVRLAGGGLLSLLGRLPEGNPGSADVPATMAAPYPPDLAALCVRDTAGEPVIKKP